MRTRLSPTYPTLKQIGPRLWRLKEPIYFSVDGRKYTVPPEFETDGASVPRILWPLFPPMSDYTNAAVVHDYLYKEDVIDDRYEADAIFLNLMLTLNVGDFRARIMHKAVNWFGGRHWQSKDT